MGKIIQTAGRNALGDLPYEEEAMRAHAKEMVFPIGAPNDGFAQYVCVAGRGYYQEEGKEAIEMKPGDCINIPTGVKHWHGAATDEWFSHLAIEVPGENSSNEWLEPVSDEEYGKL